MGDTRHTVRLSDLIGVISDDFQPSLKIVDSRVINNDIHKWPTDISDEIEIVSNSHSNRKAPKKLMQRTGPLTFNVFKAAAKYIQKKKRKVQNKGLVNAHSAPVSLQATIDRALNPVVWKRWEDDIILDGGAESNETSPRFKEKHQITPHSSLSMLQSPGLSVPKLLITSPPALSPGGSRLNESSSSILFQDAPGDGSVSSNMVVSPTSLNDSPLFGNSSHVSAIGKSSPKRPFTLKNKILNEKLAEGSWEAFIAFNESDTETDIFKAYFQPALTEMDPDLILVPFSSSSLTTSTLTLTPSITWNHAHEPRPSLLGRPDEDTFSTSLSMRNYQPKVPKILSFASISDPFNASLDKYYSHDNETELASKTSQSLALVHSVPALKLVRPQYKAWMTKSELRAFHRPIFGARYAPKITFRKQDELKEEAGMPASSLHASAMIPRSSKELTLVPGASPVATTFILVEYSEEVPPIIQKEGMGSLLYRYTRGDQAPIDDGETLGIKVNLERRDPSPFLGFGDVRPGQCVVALQNNLFRTPLFPHSTLNDDGLFLLCRPWSEGSPLPTSLIEIGQIFTAGQILPVAEVMGPQSRKANLYCKNRVEVIAFREFQRQGNLSRRARISKICRLFPQFHESVLRRWLRDTADHLRVGRDQGWWVMKKNAPTLSEDEIRSLITPETQCLYEAMLAGKQRLLDAGLGPLADEEEDDGGQGEDQETINLAPWNQTRNFMLATQGKALVELVGAGDPTGCGEGFSFNRIPLKSFINDEEKRYSIAEQQQAYREKIMKIWDAQYNSLSSSAPISEYKGITWEEATFKESLSEDPPTESGLCSNDVPFFPKTLVIRRKVSVEGGTAVQVEVIRDQRVIIEYLEQKRFEEAARLKKRKQENIEEESAIKRLKCGNCGQYGHMKTNRACPLYNTTEEESLSLVIEPNKATARRMAIADLSRIFGRIVSALTAIPNTWPFHLPVQEKIAPGYHSIIKTPMDFFTLRKNVNNRRYLSAGQFLADVKLIYTNCVTYNGQEHPFSMIAMTIVNNVEEMLQEVDPALILECQCYICCRGAYSCLLFQHRIKEAKILLLIQWLQVRLREQRASRISLDATINSIPMPELNVYLLQDIRYLGAN